jgi:sugar phosphate isomerase/epimerase
MQVGPFQVAYCTNVHPGEGLDALDAVLADDVAAVKAKVCSAAPFGMGLRLGNAAAHALDTRPGALLALSERCLNAGLYVFTVNGFPYGDFAAAAVKSAVYAPSWLDDERVEYTARLGRVLARLPGPTTRTISTVSGCFKPDADDIEAHRHMAQNLGRAAEALARVADQTGVQIRLCLEPEPWTTLETTDDTIRFFDKHLRPLAHAKAHLGLCYDCCHQAVHFEDPAESVARLIDADVPIGKVQVSSALHLDAPANPDARAALLAFDEPRYLHQVVARLPDGQLLKSVDLDPLRDPDPAWLSAEAWRCHFHVPIWWKGAGHLGTTRCDWQAAVRAIAAQNASTHLEIETYSWHVIPAAERAQMGDLHACVAAEFAALQAVLA